jgi:Fe-S-cluster containining protein
MTSKEFLESGEMCMSCGVCCIDISNAPLELEDISRIMKTYGMSFEEVCKHLAYHDPGTRSLLLRGRKAINDGGQDTTICPALDVRADGKRICQIYPNRHKICHDFACVILRDLRAYVASEGKVDTGNVFHGVADEEVRAKGLSSITFMRSLFLWTYSPESAYKWPEESLARFSEAKGILQGLVQISPATFPLPCP